MPPDTTVAAALERLGAEDVEAARLARSFVGFFGDSFDRLNRLVLECYLWSKLPEETPPERWLPTVAAVARLLELGGLDRYATVCRSQRTMRVLVSWAVHPALGERASRRAQARSPVWPDAIPELRAWSRPAGPLELAAYVHASTDVELAIASGEKRLRDVVRRSLTRPREEIAGRTCLDAVFAERIQRWLGDGARHLLLERLDLEDPIPAPDDLSPLAPLQALLAASVDGIKLRRDGRVHPREVQRLGYRGPEEDDDPSLWFRNGIVQILHTVRRFGRRQIITRIGVELLAHPEMLWRWAARRLWARPTVTCAAAEYALAVLVVDGPRDDVAGGIAPLLTSDGWRDDGKSMRPDDVAMLVRRFRQLADALGMLDEGGALTPFGRATALEALRARATAPR